MLFLHLRKNVFYRNYAFRELAPQIILLTLIRLFLDEVNCNVHETLVLRMDLDMEITCEMHNFRREEDLQALFRKILNKMHVYKENNTKIIF